MFFYLYLPDYGTTECSLKNTYIANWEEIIYPDFQFYHNPAYFNDFGHTNVEGVRLMSEFIGGEFACKLE